MSDWVKRPYRASWDEDALVYLWLKSYAHSRYGVALGASHDNTDAEKRYWEAQRPVVMRLLTHENTEVLCDPERVEPSSAGPAVLWAFACTTGDRVHYVSVKRQAVRTGLGAEMVKDLLGARLEAPCFFTHELPEMRPERIGVALPRSWAFDSTWFARNWAGKVP